MQISNSSNTTSGQHNTDHGHSTSVIEINHSNETVEARPGMNVFIVASTAQTGDVIDGFTLGEDALKFAGHVNTAELSVQESGNNTLVTDGTHTILTLDGVQTTSLQSLLSPQQAPPPPPPPVGPIVQSVEPLWTTGGKETFAVDAAGQGSQVIDGFTPGQDDLLINGLHGQSLPSAITLAPDHDGVSTDVDLASDGHTLVTLENVLPAALAVHQDYIS